MTEFTEQERIRLVEYFDGRIDPTTLGELEAWIAAEPGRDAEVARLRLAWEVAGQMERGAWPGVLRLGASSNPVAVPEVKPKRRSGTPNLRIGRIGMWMGASAVAFAGFLLFGRRIMENRSPTGQVYAAGNNQQKIVTLNDGSRVTLAPKTTLRVEQLGARMRVVSLDSGEAYFEVAHTVASPFMVRSGAAITQVLGTAFLIRYEAGNKHVRVSVTDGKVRVIPASGRGAGVTLTVGQSGDVTGATMQVSTAENFRPNKEGEAQGHIAFRDTPLPIVLQMVSQWYGYRFRYTDPSLNERNVTMVVSARSSAEALAALERALSVKIVVVGDTVTLVPHSQLSPSVSSTEQP